MWDPGGADPDARPTMDGLTGAKIAVPDADGRGRRSSSPPRAAGTSRSRRRGASIEPARALDATRPLFTVALRRRAGEELAGDHFGRAWHAIAVAAAAESVGVAAARDAA